MLGVTLGVAMVGLAHPGEALHHRRALAFALANAVVIMTYTFIDGMRRGAPRWRPAAARSATCCCCSCFDGVPYPAAGGAQSATPRAAARSSTTRKRRWPLAALGGCGVDRLVRDCAVGDDALRQLAAVSALRETSVLFALLGAWLLKSGSARNGWWGRVVIVGGVIALRFG